ncbi:hypothetical protein ACFQ3S_09680 [Mucilaginibacter terrae]|uniref:hypothetical protein n=1 Tax=Mucilaginibacter terrae TaxID=1955052 RepID=UPI00362E91AF
MYYRYILVFFLCLVLAACKQRKPEITLVMQNNHAVGLRIPATLVDKIAGIIQVCLLKKGNQIKMLGILQEDGTDKVFRPLIPFSPGLTYTVFKGEKQIGKITVPVYKNKVSPELVSIYPNLDTLPENLLKIYLKFTQPMRTGQSLEHIKLLNSKNDTLNVFLNLQPELWDTTGTMLTLWLDPGRIKRDLEPNLRLGNPLKQGENYTLLISNRWTNTQGKALKQTYHKAFIVGQRDNASPAVSNWKLNSPTAGSVKPLTVNTIERLDHYLLEESVFVLNAEGEPIKGSVKTNTNDTGISFTPAEAWQPGPYIILVNARLEDLAGNNLNRLFDRDITKDRKRDQDVYKRKFTISCHFVRLF